MSALEIFYKERAERLEAELKEARERINQLLNPIYSGEDHFLQSVLIMYENDKNMDEALKSIEAAKEAVRYAAEDSGGWRDDPLGKILMAAMREGPDFTDRLLAAIPDIPKTFDPAELIPLFFDEEVKEKWMEKGVSRAVWVKDNVGTGLCREAWVHAAADREWEEWRDLHAEAAIEAGTGPKERDAYVGYDSAKKLMDTFGSFGWGSNGPWMHNATPNIEKREKDSFEPNRAAFNLGLAELIKETLLKGDTDERISEKWGRLAAALFSEGFDEADARSVFEGLDSLPADYFKNIRCRVETSHDDIPETAQAKTLIFNGKLTSAFVLSKNEDLVDLALRKGIDVDDVRKGLQNGPQNSKWDRFRSTETTAWVEKKTLFVESLIQSETSVAKPMRRI